MAKALALNIGLNAVDPRHYRGWNGALRACEADALDMASIATSKRFTVKKLLTKMATRTAVSREIKRAATLLKSGDIFLLSYSGHGGQVPDLNGDEPDAQDETWCLYDGQLVDDELFALLGGFAAGVRVLVFSDSCHSGTVVKQAYYRGMEGATETLDAEPVLYRAMPPGVALRTYRDHQKFYDKILKNRKLKDAMKSVSASVMLFSGCQDNQLSADGIFNGRFTGQMLRVWNNGRFKGDYRGFHREIARRMPPDQTPNYFQVGAANPKFEGQAPFAV
jgi:metacaspase-1